jgi:tRNA G18 (ribose-2'-O)-methylase SpoU
MPRIPIDHLDDSRIAIYRHLKANNRTRTGGQFVVEGEKLVDRLLASPFPTATALVTDRHEPRIAPRLPPDVPLFVVPHAMIHALVGFNFHQGILACGVRRPWPDLEDLVCRAGPRATLVVCPRLDNPENLGSIVRIADVFGVVAVVVGGRCPDPLSRRVLRVSMGTALRLPVLASTDLERDAERLGSWGFERVAAVAEPGAEPFGAARRPPRLALFLGCEGSGLGPEWVARCDRRVTIPMRPGAESLNVAVAAGILLHHFARAPAEGRG